MAVRVIEGMNDSGLEYAVLYCSTTMTAFGPLLKDREDAETFLQFLKQDPRSMPPNVLELAFRRFRKDEDE